jgi:hypothetical protein
VGSGLGCAPASARFKPLFSNNIVSARLFDDRDGSKAFRFDLQQLVRDIERWSLSSLSSAES